MTAIARVVALELLNRVYTDDAYANLLLPKLIRKYKLDARDSALAQEIGFGAIRQKLFLDAVIEHAADRKIAQIDPAVLTVLELGSYQLLFTRVPKHAALNESVDQSKQLQGGRLSGFANAVLRRVSEKSDHDWLEQLCKGKSASRVQELRSAHPGWIATALSLALKADGAEGELEQTLIANNRPAAVNLVALPGRASISDTKDLQPTEASPIGFLAPSGNPGDFDAVRQGRLRVQDAGSQLVAITLVEAKPVAPDETWLDLCAGPGGKAVLLAALAQQESATLVCNEPSPHRAELVRSALKTSGFNSEVLESDGREIKGTFDRILLDAPCSGLGALRRRPEARWRKQPSDIPELAKLQAELIDSAWRALKPGGVLLYATCSPHPAETTAVIEGALRRFGTSASLMDANQVLADVNPNMTLNRKRKTAQLWPHRHGTDAMFMALIAKSVS